MSLESAPYFDSNSETPLIWRWLRRLYTFAMPALGWPAFILLMALAYMPALTLRNTEWLELGSFQWTVDLSGPLAVIAGWALLGWRRDRFSADMGRWRLLFLSLVFVAIGALVLLQLAVGWLPGPLRLWDMLSAGNWLGPVNHIAGELGRVVSRFVLWRQGIMAGGAAQDNLVLSLLIAGVYWLLIGTAVLLARKTEKGLYAALPSVWLVLIQLAYTSANRGVFIYAMFLTILLHLVLDQRRLIARWMRLGMDYNPGIGLERFLTAGMVVAAIIGISAIFPNVYIAAVAQAYYDRVAPFNEQIEGSIERGAPDFQGLSRMRRSGMGGGLPNDFLLRGGPDLRQIEVLRYRTDDAWLFDFPFDEIGPPGYYMRGGTYANYNGRGWGNPSGTERQPYEAEERREVDLDNGRRELVQSVTLLGPTQILYAAPELVEASVSYRLETRDAQDIVAAWSRERNYTVVSAVPAVSEQELQSMPFWEEAELNDDRLAIHLELPDTVTDRTRELAEELTRDHDNAYDKASAIEAYLRTYEYDLTVSAPPGNVADIADYFLFDLQRGYCDYYATAFVVLARLSGLPARFATGFAAGYWDVADMSHVVTEADAHSWAEVYFPEVGWIPFEPTAARGLFLREGSIGWTPGEGIEAAAPVPAAPVETETSATDFNWQVWLWLIPLALVGWGVFAFWRTRRGQSADPWSEVLNWGRRLGRPIDNHETPLEYGQNLGTYMLDRLRTNQDTGRVVARELQGLGEDISDWRYGPHTQKPEANERAHSRWERLRGYRRTIRLKS